MCVWGGGSACPNSLARCDERLKASSNGRIITVLRV